MSDQTLWYRKRMKVNAPWLSRAAIYSGVANGHIVPPRDGIDPPPSRFPWSAIFIVLFFGLLGLYVYWAITE